MAERRGIRRKQLLDELQEAIGYWKLKEEALDRTLRRTRFGRSLGTDIKQATQRINSNNPFYVHHSLLSSV